jgi:hypothetical protein
MAKLSASETSLGARRSRAMEQLGRHAPADALDRVAAIGPEVAGSTHSASAEPTGSASTMRTPGTAARRHGPTPVIVPPVPAPATNAPTRPPVCSRISTPVVSSCTRDVGGVAN